MYIIMCKCCMQVIINQPILQKLLIVVASCVLPMAQFCSQVVLLTLLVPIMSVTLGLHYKEKLNAHVRSLECGRDTLPIAVSSILQYLSLFLLFIRSVQYSDS